MSRLVNMSHTFFQYHNHVDMLSSGSNKKGCNMPPNRSFFDTAHAANWEDRRSYSIDVALKYWAFCQWNLSLHYDAYMRHSAAGFPPLPESPNIDIDVSSRPWCPKTRVPATEQNSIYVAQGILLQWTQLESNQPVSSLLLALVIGFLRNDWEKRLHCVNLVHSALRILLDEGCSWQEGFSSPLLLWIQVRETYG